MARANDVGGLEGFGDVPAIDTDTDQAGPFAADWEARIYGIHRVLTAAGVYRGEELRDAVERLHPVTYLTAGYYERWVLAIEGLLHEKGLLPAGPHDGGHQHPHLP